MSVLARNTHTTVDASSSAVSMTFPTTGLSDGDVASLEKTDSSGNVVTVTGRIRGVAAQSITLSLYREAVGFRYRASDTSWYPVSGHKTLTSLDSRYSQGAAAALQVVMRKLVHGESANVGIASDSTADAVNEWPALLGTLLGGQFATYTVKWYPADTTGPGNGYGSPTTLQTGTGGTPPVLSIYNQSIPGQNALAFLGQNFTTNFITPALDAVLVSTGHNEGSVTGDPSNLGFPRQQLAMRIQQFTEQLRALSPDTAIVLIAQHPHLDGTGDMDIKRDEYRSLAVRRGYGFIDMFQAWTDQGTGVTTAWYADNIHMVLAGETFYATEIFKSFRYEPKLEPRPMPPSLLHDTRPTIIDNLVMPAGAATPVGWSALNCTVSRDTTNYEGPRGYAVRTVLTTAGSNARIFRQVLNAAEILPHRGKWITIAVRQRRVAAGGVNNRYTGQIVATDGTNTSRSFTDDYSFGDFMWRFVPHFVAAGSTGLTLSLNADATSDGSMVNPDVTWEKVLIFPGLTIAGHGEVRGPRSTRDMARFEAVTVGESTLDVTPNLDLDAKSGITRSLRVLTAGLLRWQFNFQTAETGSNLGSDFLLLARADDGSTLVGTALTIARQTMGVTLGAWIKTKAYVTGSRPNATTAGDGAQLYDSTLHRPIWSDASTTAAWNAALVGLTGTATLDFPSIAAGAQSSLTITVTGAATGDVVALGPPSTLEAGLSAVGYVSATNTVTVRMTNTTGSAIDPASATWKAAIIR